MTTKINVAGVWKSPSWKINIAGTWKDITGKINVAGVWKTIYSALSALFNTNGDGNFRFGATCYAGIQINSNGSEYEYINTGGTTNIGTWLKAGTAAEVWVLMTVSSGSWNSINSGVGSRLQCSTTRSWRIVQSSNGVRTVQCRLRFYDAASGGNLLDDTGTITFTAEYGV